MLSLVTYDEIDAIPAMWRYRGFWELPDEHALELKEWADQIHRIAARRILGNREEFPPGTIAYGTAQYALYMRVVGSSS